VALFCLQIKKKKMNNDKLKQSDDNKNVFDAPEIQFFLNPTQFQMMAEKKPNNNNQRDHRKERRNSKQSAPLKSNISANVRTGNPIFGPVLPKNDFIDLLEKRLERSKYNPKKRNKGTSSSTNRNNGDHSSFEMIEVDLDNKNLLDNSDEHEEEEDVLLIQQDKSSNDDQSIDYLTGKGNFKDEDDPMDSSLKKRKKNIYLRRNSTKKGKFEEMKFGEDYTDEDEEDDKKRRPNNKNKKNNLLQHV
jgi:hypothetical protein